MKRLGYGLLTLAALCGPPARAQQAALPPNKIEWLDADHHPLPAETGATYRRETDYADSVAATVKTYYLATGRLASQEGYDNLRKRLPNGVFEWWYPDGQLQMHGEFRHGRRAGELRTYYPSGQLKRREVYDPKNDFSSHGECFAENGQPVPFYKFEQMPVYPDGDGSIRVIIRAIQRGIKYPKEARKAGCAGRVIAAFNVTAEGTVADLRIVQSVCPALDEAVLQAVRQLKPFKPGEQDGRPVSVAFTIPISFALW